MQGESQILDVREPVANCSYQAPNSCTGFEPLSCCERVGAGALPQVQISMSATFLVLLLSMLMAAY